MSRALNGLFVAAAVLAYTSEAHSAPLCDSAACRAAQLSFEQRATAEYLKAAAEGAALLTRSADDPRYAVSSSRRQLQTLCEDKKGAPLIYVVEARREGEAALKFDAFYSVSAKPRKSSCDDVKDRMALGLKNSRDAAATEFPDLARRLAQALPKPPEALTPAQALVRMRAHEGVSLLVPVTPAPAKPSPAAFSFLPDIINLSVAGTSGGLPVFTRPPPRAAPVAPERPRRTAPAPPSAAPPPSAPPSPAPPPEEPAIAFDQLVSSKPGEKIYVEMDAAGNAQSFRFEIDPMVTDSQAPAQ